MPNQRQSNGNQQVDRFSEALATARNMQQDWLNYGVDFVHIYVDDVHGDWLERWEEESVLDLLKEFLVSNDDVAAKVRQILGERSLFDIAVNLEECLNLSQETDRLYAIKNVLANREKNYNISCEIDDIELLNLANSLLEKLTEIL
ncbi:hypothetical protein H6G81_24350 [Scytonema hofmannii FACHB-248]|uniref:Uncharacterized protein n=1 Tax=Scytonema hofmannii FACHB-248 TaxID=1842502 RepID=A0ABR8GWT9_9CYAN|nr:MULTISPECIES: hypothetical protein [Nostocales]MBD2607569.1 hypothetical protein [Scytonema hofmannii FACHB-248]